MKRRSVWVVEHKKISGRYEPAVCQPLTTHEDIARALMRDRAKQTGDEYRVVRYDASK